MAAWAAAASDVRIYLVRTTRQMGARVSKQMTAGICIHSVCMAFNCSREHKPVTTMHRPVGGYETTHWYRHASVGRETMNLVISCLLGSPAEALAITQKRALTIPRRSRRLSEASSLYSSDPFQICTPTPYHPSVLRSCICVSDMYPLSPHLFSTTYE